MLHFVLCDDNIQVLNRLEKTLETIFIKNDIDAQISFKAAKSDELLNYIKYNTDICIFLSKIHAPRVEIPDTRLASIFFCILNLALVTEPGEIP